MEQSFKTTLPNQADARNAAYDVPVAPVVSVGEWIIASLLLLIPIVNFILLLIWAFGSNTNPNKANWAKASLLLMVILGLASITLLGINAALFYVP